MAGSAAGALLTALALTESRRECSALTRRDYTVRSGKLSREIRLMFLSDLHDKVFSGDNEELLEGIEAFRPDAVLIGGDMMVVKKTAEIGLTLALVEKLARRWPVCYADGNHETRLNRDRGRYGDLYDRLAEGLRRAGVIHLTDATAELFPGVTVSGLTITQAYYRKVCPPEMPVSYLRERLGEPEKEKFRILLAHSPLFFDAYGEWGADLTLAGHFHGGTIRLPGGAGLMTPQFQFLRRDVWGRHDRRVLRDGKREVSSLIVSAGLGTHSINLRLNNPPELVAVRLLPEGQG